MKLTVLFGLVLILAGLPHSYLAAQASPGRVSTYLGGPGNDDVRGVAFLSDGTIVVAANLSALPAGVTPSYVAGATAADAGTVLRLSADGNTVLSATVVSTVVADLSVDGADRVYVAAGPTGIVRLSNAGTTLDYAFALPQNAHRVDAGPAGYVVGLSDDQNSYDQTQLLDARVILLDPTGTELFNTSGATTFTTDVAVDEATQSVYSTGFKNFRTLDAPGGSVNPVDVPAVKSVSFANEDRFRAYDWSSDSGSDRWLNLPENNMADARGTRLEIGDDGLLYCLFEADGGNHCFRYDPFEISTPVSIVGGDRYFQFFNSRTEPKMFVGRYDPLTGAYLLGQQFCARLSNGSANTVRTRFGNLAVNMAGEPYITGRAFSSIPLTEDVFNGGYQGGGFILKLSSDFATRELLSRRTVGEGRAVAVGPGGAFAYGGSSNEVVFTTAGAIQTSPAGGGEGWLVAQPGDATLPVTYHGFRAWVTHKQSVELRWSFTATASHAGFEVERADERGSFERISPRLSRDRRSYVDEGQKHAGTYYYRLRQIERDGTSSTSATVVVGIGASQSVFPNPTNGVFTLTDTEPGQPFRLLDGAGHEVMRGLTVAGRTVIDGSALGSGVYSLVVGGQIYRVVIR